MGTKLQTRVEKQERYYIKKFTNDNMKEALIALNLVNEYHNGKRKDGSEEKSHMYEVAGKVIRDLENRIETKLLEKIIVTAFLHDLIEDTSVTEEYLIEKGISKETIVSINYVTKKDGFKKIEEDYIEYHGGISEDLASVLVKGYDRCHNLQSCLRVFSPKRKLEYVEETEKYIIPNLKKMRKVYFKIYTPITGIILELKNLNESVTYIAELETKLKEQKNKND